MNKVDVRKLSEYERQIKRDQVRKVYSSTGGNAAKTAEKLGVSRYFIIKWTKSYREQWNQAREEGRSVKDIELKPKKRGRRADKGRKVKASYNDVSWEVKNEAKEIIKNNAPHQVGINSLLWTERAVKKLFKLKFNIDISHETVYWFIRMLIFFGSRYRDNYREFKDGYHSYNGYGLATVNGYIYFLKETDYIDYSDFYKLVLRQRKKKSL